MYAYIAATNTFAPFDTTMPSTGAATLARTIIGTADFSGLTAATAVPEPSTYTLLGLGALLIALRARWRRAQP